MSAILQRSSVPYSQFEQLREARAIVKQEAEALEQVAERLDLDFCRAVELVCQCRGSVLVTGMGKAGLIGQKITATLCSTGTRAHFLHPAEAVHGDLGCLHWDDVVLALSNSGETEEVSRLLPVIRRMNVPLVAITASEASTLGSNADAVVRLGRLHEAGHFGLAPSTSTTAMLAVGDALALVVSRLKGFTPQQFAVFHPAGSLGQRLSRVSEIMRKAEQLRISSQDATVREVFASAGKLGRRTGAIMLVDSHNRLCGLFTDSDLARLLEQRREEQLDKPIAEVMTVNPLTIDPDATLSDVVELLSTRKLSELPVINDDGRPIGLIDITDVIALMPQEERPD